MGFAQVYQGVGLADSARQDEGGAYGNRLCFAFQHGAENGGKRKKDRNLDDLKKEVALVRTEDLLECPATLRRAAVVKKTL